MQYHGGSGVRNRGLGETMKAVRSVEVEPPMKVVCAWCKRTWDQKSKIWELRGENELDGVSHSICNDCKVEVEAQVRRHYGHV